MDELEQVAHMDESDQTRMKLVPMLAVGWFSMICLVLVLAIYLCRTIN